MPTNVGSLDKGSFGDAAELSSVHVKHIERLLEQHQTRTESLLACSEQRIIEVFQQALSESQSQKRDVKFRKTVSSNSQVLNQKGSNAIMVSKRTMQDGPQKVCQPDKALTNVEPIMQDGPQKGCQPDKALTNVEPIVQDGPQKGCQLDKTLTNEEPISPRSSVSFKGDGATNSESLVSNVEPGSLSIVSYQGDSTTNSALSRSRTTSSRRLAASQCLTRSFQASEDSWPGHSWPQKTVSFKHQTAILESDSSPQKVGDMLEGLEAVRKHIKDNHNCNKASIAILLRGKNASNLTGILNSYCFSIVSNPKFAHLVQGVILCNSIAIVAETHWQTNNHGAESIFFSHLEMTFTFFFCIELLMRLIVLRKSFCTGADWRWNIWDLIIVLATVTEAVLKVALLIQNSSQGLVSLRAIRTLRLARTIRVVRVMHSFRELRLVLHGIISALSSMLWLIAILCFLMFIAAVHVTQTVTEVLAHDPVDEQSLNLLEEHWSNLPRTCYSLFKSISAGQDWGELANPLFDISFSAGSVFVAFVSFTLFGILNVVTGIFVDNAQKSSDEDAFLELMEKSAKKEKLIGEIRQLFEAVDRDNDNMLSFEEFSDHIQHPAIQAYFRMLKIDVDKIGKSGLFSLLDLDGSGYIDLDEFVTGCTKIRGKARALDIASVHYDVRKQALQLEKLQQCVVEVLQCLLPEELNDDSQELGLALADVAWEEVQEDEAVIQGIGGEGTAQECKARSSQKNLICM